MTGQLTAEDLRRYSRHLLLPGFGVEGQVRLLHASALLVGLGRQGMAASLYLAAAGVGRLGLVEPEDGEGLDFVHYSSCGEESALAGAAPRRLQALNPAVRVEEYLQASMADLVARYDVVVGCVRSARWRQELNRLCLAQGKPLVGAAVRGWEGHAFTMVPGEGPCWNCVFPDDSDGVLTEGLGSLVAGAVGILQATEAIKVLLGLGEPLSRRYLFLDGMTGRFRQVKCHVDPGCPYCSGQKGE
ncbi:MAG: HesA/MoeB/ThiF family protein [Bacillota bacterium]